MLAADENQKATKSPFTTMYLSLSSQSSAASTKRIIESYLHKRRKTVIGPPVGKVAVIFVDDINTAGRDKFGTQVCRCSELHTVTLRCMLLFHLCLLLRFCSSYILPLSPTPWGEGGGQAYDMHVGLVYLISSSVFALQSSVELLRQWCSTGGWHDEQKSTFKEVVDSQMVGAITVTPFQTP